jgi:hypothetical protein
MQALLSEPLLVNRQPSSTLQEFSPLIVKQETSSTVLYSHTSFPEAIAEMFKKLKRFHDLAPNWDSYGAEPPAPLAISRAISFLMRNYKLALPFYFIAPGANREIMLEFQRGNKAAELYFLPEGNDELILFENDQVVGEGNFDTLFRELINHFND